LTVLLIGLRRSPYRPLPMVSVKLTYGRKVALEMFVACGVLRTVH